MNLSCSAVPQRTSPPSLRLAPEPGDERPQQQLLGETHAGVRRHFESAEFDKPEPPGRAVRRIELVDADFGAMGVAGNVDQQIAEQPVDQPQRKRSARPAPACWRARSPFRRAIVPRLVDARRLAGRPDEQPGEQIGQRRMPLPIEHEALQADPAGAGTANPPAWRRRARRGCRRRCRYGGRRS